MYTTVNCINCVKSITAEPYVFEIEFPIDFAGTPYVKIKVRYVLIGCLQPTGF